MNVLLELTLRDKGNTNPINSLKCRIDVDIEHGTISIFGIHSDSMTTLIDIIGQTFEILDIKNIDEATDDETSSDFSKKQKANVDDEDIQKQLNKLNEVIVWAERTKHVKSRDICRHLMLISREMIVKYSSKTAIYCEVGDVVTCNYGAHLKNEVSGGNIQSIICNIDDNGLVYAIPISTSRFDGDDYMPVKAEDIKYCNEELKGSTVILKMGKYINRLRINEVIGHASPDFLHNLLVKVASMHDFSAKSCKSLQSSKTQIQEVNGGSTADVESSNEEVKKDERIIEKISERIPAKNYLEDMFSYVFKAMDKKENNIETMEDKVNFFLSEISFPNTKPLVREAFLVSEKVDKVVYENIIMELHKLHPDEKEEKLKRILKGEFDEWLRWFPDIKSHYSKCSIMMLIKLFTNHVY